jgi:uncharacterized protein YutE (UPF0331/DUF86 family)
MTKAMLAHTLIEKIRQALREVRTADRGVLWGGREVDWLDVRSVLAKLYLQAGQTQAVIDQCREILKLDPKDQTALYHLIQTLRKTGNTKEIPDLLKRLSDLRVEATKKETEHNRHKLVEVGTPTSEPSQP